MEEIIKQIKTEMTCLQMTWCLGLQNKNSKKDCWWILTLKIFKLTVSKEEIVVMKISKNQSRITLKLGNHALQNVDDLTISEILILKMAHIQMKLRID